MLQYVCENCVRILEEKKHRQLRIFVILRKKWKKLAKAWKAKNSAYTRENCWILWQKVCVKRHQYQFTAVLNNCTFRRHHWDEFCIKTLVWRHIKFDWFRSWSQLTIQCVFASLSGPAIDLQKIPILAKKNHLFIWSSFWFWRVYKQAKLSQLGHRKPARIHWKADAPKMSPYLVWPFLFENEQE